MLRIFSLLIVTVMAAQFPRAYGQTWEATVDKYQLQADAEAGGPDAQFQMGERYLEGRTIPRDRSMAYFWFNIAAANGSTAAVAERDKLGKLLTPAQVEMAESESRDWRPKEFLETPALREVFGARLRILIFTAEHNGFALSRTTKRNPPAHLGDVWDTRIRFPGATSQACSALAPNLAMAPGEEVRLGPLGIDCVVLSSDPAKVRRRLEEAAEAVWNLLPQGWCRPSPKGFEFASQRNMYSPNPAGAGITVGVVDVPGGSQSLLSISIHPQGGREGCDRENPLYLVKVSGDGSSRTSDGSDIQREIDSIARNGHYTPLPETRTEATRSASVASAVRIVRNDTAYTLHLLMSGPVDRKMDVAPGSSSTLDVPPGTYRVAARVDGASVLPFYGVQVFETGTQYTSQFYIK